MDINSKIEQIEKQLKEQIGELNANDKYWYDLLIDAYKDYYTAIDNIEKYGQIILNNNKTMGRPNPSIIIKNEAHKQIKNILKQFNILPEGRKGTPNSKTLDDMI
jgi:P27 family predicted phage terminase small subunit